MKFEDSMDFSGSEGFNLSGNQSLDLDMRSQQEIIDQLYSMIKIRSIEHKIANMRSNCCWNFKIPS